MTARTGQAGLIPEILTKRQDMEHTERPTSPTEDSRLMSAVTRQDGRALETLIRKYRALVFRTALRIVCSADDAEDITQEVFIRVWKQAGRFNSRSGLPAWLYRITCNLSIDHLRRRKIRFTRMPWKDSVEAGRIPEKGLPREKSSEEKMIESEEWRMFTEATAGLSPKQRAVFTLKEIEELDTMEVAAITGLSPDRIKSNLYLARKTIRDKLGMD